MKKKLMSMGIVFVLLMFLAACGTSESGGQKGPKEDKTPVLALSEMVSGKNCEITLDYIEVAAVVEPPQVDGAYSYYEADLDKLYVDVCIAYKNLNDRGISADEVMSGLLLYKGSYEYKGFAIIEEDGRSDFTYANITDIDPLATEYVHYLFEIPEEVGKSDGQMEAVLTISGEKYKVIVQEGSTGMIKLDRGNGKTKGEVGDEELIVLGKSEFFVDYSDITSRVEPIQPGSFYSYYEAETGKTYVDFCMGYKNYSEKEVAADRVISAKLKYDGIYEYEGFAIIEEENRTDFTYANITGIAPLATEYIHYLFEVPEEVEDSNKDVVVHFSVEGKNFTYQVR